MKTILCFGDSNVWGDDPAGGPRFGRDVRWPGVLQEVLGSDFYVIEEGLCGGTTDLDDKGSHVRNGLNYLPACVKSHAPLDYCFIMLGTNDLKDRFNRAAADIAQAVGRLVQCVRSNVGDNEGRSLKICVMSPAPINPSAPRFAQYMLPSLAGAYEKSLQLAAELRKVANANNCMFLDIAPEVNVGEDGLHLTPNSHTKVAQLVSAMIEPA